MAGNRQGSSLLKTEDWLAVWLGFLIIALVLVAVRPDLPKFRWATDAGFAATVAEKKPAVERLIKDAEAKGEADLAAAASGLKAAMDKGERAAIGGAAKKLGDAGKAAKDAGLKKRAGDLAKLAGDAGAVVGKVVSGENLWTSAKIGIAYLVLSAIGIALMGGSVGKYVVGFPRSGR